MLSKTYHDVPCLHIICNSNDIFFIMQLNLNLSLNGIITDVGRCVMVPFKVIRTSFQSIFTTSHNTFLFNVICSGVKCPKFKINEYFLWFHSLIGMYRLTFKKNSITATVLENNSPWNILHFVVVAKMKSVRPMIINASAAIVYYCALQVQC